MLIDRDWPQIKQHLVACADLPPAQREHYLTAARADAQLLGKVRRLLAVDERRLTCLEQPLSSWLR